MNKKFDDGWQILTSKPKSDKSGILRGSSIQMQQCATESVTSINDGPLSCLVLERDWCMLVL